MLSKEVKQRRQANLLRRSLVPKRRKVIHRRCLDIQSRWAAFDVAHNIDFERACYTGDDLEGPENNYRKDLAEWFGRESRQSRQHLREDIEAGVKIEDAIIQDAYVQSSYNNNEHVPLYSTQIVQYKGGFKSKEDQDAET